MDLKQAFFQVKILHAALFGGVLLFGGISFVFHNQMNIGDSLVMLPDNAFYPVVLLAGVLLWLSGVLYKNRVSKIDAALALEERISIYRQASILRVAIIEAASLTVIMGYLLTGDIAYLLIALVPLSFFVFTFPTNEIMIEALDLSYSEEQQLG